MKGKERKGNKIRGQLIDAIEWQGKVNIHAMCACCAGCPLLLLLLSHTKKTKPASSTTFLFISRVPIQLCAHKERGLD